MRSLCSFFVSAALILCGATTAWAQAAPPPAYPPPPAGAPPAYQPPAGFVAQPGYPPAGQPYAPPPGYGPPPGYAPVPPPQPMAKHGFLALVFLGVHSFRGKTGDNLDAGLRTGAILGGRLNGRFSLNGELTLDVLNPSSVPSGTSVSAAEVDITLSPLLHVPLSEKVELVVGPKLGIWAGAASTTTDGLDSSSSAHGLAAGVNLGVFGAVSRSVSIGALVSFVLRNVTEVCLTEFGESESCSSDHLPDADKVLSFAAGALF